MCIRDRRVSERPHHPAVQLERCVQERLAQLLARPAGRGPVSYTHLDVYKRQHPALCELPFILETPHDDLAGYAGEIAYLRGLAG